MIPFHFRLAFLALTILCQTGCKHLGPSTIVADRVPYNNAIAASWQEQTLLNIVKLRYFDTPFFVDVAQITSGYTKQNSATTGLAIVPPFFPQAPFDDELGANLGLQTMFQDRPTISYTPQTGSQFIRNLTTPLPPSSVLFMIQAGYPADVVLELVADSINGIRNRSTSGGEVQAGDPEFRYILQVLRRAQLTGDVNMRIEHDKDKKETVILVIHDKNVDPELAAQLAEVRKLLRLDPSMHEFRVTFGTMPREPNEIAILTRSVFRILSVLATHVEPPLCHLNEGRAPPLGQTDHSGDQPFRVCSGLQKPKDCFASVCYRGHWFWIDDRDARSKRVFIFLLAFLALADTGPKEGLPLVTIQAN